VEPTTTAVSFVVSVNMLVAVTTTNSCNNDYYTVDQLLLPNALFSSLKPGRKNDFEHV